MPSTSYDLDQHQHATVVPVQLLPRLRYSPSDAGCCHASPTHLPFFHFWHYSFASVSSLTRSRSSSISVHSALSSNLSMVSSKSARSRNSSRSDQFGSVSI